MFENNKVLGEDYTLTIINENNVIGCNVHSYGKEVVVEVPEGVVMISAYAFDGCGGIKEIKLPSTVKTIGQNAFANNSDLQIVRIPQSVETIGKHILKNCPKLKRCSLPDKFSKKYENNRKDLVKYLRDL